VGFKTVYLPAGADIPGLITLLEQAGINIIGTSRNGELPANWIATLRSNPMEPFRQALTSYLQGESANPSAHRLEITDVNPELFSPARQKLAESILDDLEAGFIFTGVE
jgi:hypothetical protein